MDTFLERRKENTEQFWFTDNFYDKMLPARCKFYHRRILPMTIAVALIGKDAIVLATDSRWCEKAEDSEDLYYHDKLKKLWKLSGTLALACTTNDMAYSYLLIELFKQKITQQKLDESNIGEIVDKFSYLANNNLGRHFNRPFKKLIEQGTPSLLLISAGMCFIFVGFGKNRNPQIGYCTKKTGEMAFHFGLWQQPFFLAGVPKIGMYLRKKIESQISELNLKSLKRLAVILILETATLEPSVGGAIQMVVIPKDGKSYELPEAELTELEAYIKKNIEKLDKGFLRMVKG